ncbi:hypothetical protein [Paenibacillus kribbensis]|nr:hypothetical protein [Paenibacillus kribbensis]
MYIENEVGGMVLYKRSGRFCPRISTFNHRLHSRKSGGGGDGKHHPTA